MKQNAATALPPSFIDRYPPANLLEIIAIKRSCRDAGIEKLEAGPKGAVVSLRENRFANPAGLVDLIQRHAGTLKLRPDQKIVYLRDWHDAKTRLTGAAKLAQALAKIARGLAGKKVEGVNYPDGRFAVRHEGVVLPFRVFDKIQTVAPGAIVENKRLGAALGFVRELQASYPPNRRRGDPRRQRPPNNLEAPGMPTKGRPQREVLAAAAAK